jgi:DNA-binding transcriptional regulator YiaG
MKIKQLRLLANMTQQQFADYFEIPKRTIEDWENERRKPPQYLVNLIKYKLTMEKVI